MNSSEYNKDAFEVLLMDYATRQNVKRVATVDAALRNVRTIAVNVNRSDIISYFHILEKDGFGKFRCGRRGGKTRFEWVGNRSANAYYHYFPKRELPEAA